VKNQIDVMPPVVRDRNATTLMRIHTSADVFGNDHGRQVKNAVRKVFE
jgi:hypothetical protein